MCDLLVGLREHDPRNVRARVKVNSNDAEISERRQFIMATSHDRAPPRDSTAGTCLMGCRSAGDRLGDHFRPELAANWVRRCPGDYCNIGRMWEQDDGHLSEAPLGAGAVTGETTSDRRPPTGHRGRG